jgi:ABC-type multidrug transport system ATPase subunit
LSPDGDRSSPSGARWSAVGDRSSPDGGSSSDEVRGDDEDRDEDRSDDEDRDDGEDRDDDEARNEARDGATLVVDELAVRRGGRVVIDGVSLTVDAGEIVGIVGANGSGKSTLLACIAGVLAPREGIVRVTGASVWGTRRERAEARRVLGYVPEGADPPGFLVADELWSLCAAARSAAPPSPELRDALGLDELRTQPLERMSLGQRRRACLGAAFIGPPKLLVLDEPDNGLDTARLDALVELIVQHAAAEGACVLASHDAALLDRLGARIVTLPARSD